MFAFNPPQVLIDFVAGVGPVFVVALLGAVVTLTALIALVPNAKQLGLIDRVLSDSSDAREVVAFNLLCPFG